MAEWLVRILDNRKADKPFQIFYLHVYLRRKVDFRNLKTLAEMVRATGLDPQNTKLDLSVLNGCTTRPAEPLFRRLISEAMNLGRSAYEEG